MQITGITVAGLFLLSAAHIARAEEMSGKQLIALCSTRDAAPNIVCNAYIAGFLEGLSSGLTSTMEITKGAICLPGKPLPVQEGRNMAAEFLQRHPEAASYSAREVMTLVMWNAYPCK